MMLTFKQLQQENSAWAERNFPGKREFWEPTLGVVEETSELIAALGQLSHALLKRHQGIRGSVAEHEAAARDAVGDVTIYLAHLCTTLGWSYQDVVEQTWARVQRRNWVADPLRGGEGDGAA